MSSPDLALDLTLACSRFSRLAARRADVGVSSVTWRVTATLAERGPLRLSEIAAHEQVTRPTATAVVQRLEEEGLVARRPDPGDSRSSLVELTPVGRERLAAWRARLSTGVEDLLAGLPPREVEALGSAARLLRHLVDTAERTSRPA